MVPIAGTNISLNWNKTNVTSKMELNISEQFTYDCKNGFAFQENNTLKVSNTVNCSDTGKLSVQPCNISSK